MKVLSHDKFLIVDQYLSSFKNHTILRTILDGSTSGKVYVDNLDSPQTIFIQFRHRAFIMGDRFSIDKEDFDHFLTGIVFENCKNSGVSLVRLTTENAAWIDFLDSSLKPHNPLLFDYQIYKRKISHSTSTEINIPEKCLIRNVDQKLISETFKGKEELLEELCSERESVDSFLNHSFGVAAFHGSTLAGWCLSEYNHKDHCEVGIATMPAFQRKGLAKAMIGQFIIEAREMGIHTVLWHCFKSNIPSSKTAQSTGFELIDEHKVLNIYLDPSVSLAVHGNLEFEKGNFGRALPLYQQSLSLPRAQVWMAWNAACAAAHQHLDDLVFHYLDLAIDLGFSDITHLLNSEHFIAYHGAPRWEEIKKILSIDKSVEK